MFKYLLIKFWPMLDPLPPEIIAVTYIWGVSSMDPCPPSEYPAKSHVNK